MKKISLAFIFSFSIVLVFSQAPPQLINYQGVARDNVGNPLTNQNISLLLKVLQTNTNGTIVYSETHNVTTGQFAEFDVHIGSGTIVSGVFADIDWGADDYFFRVEMDQTGGSNYLYLGTSQFVTVPYAFYAEKSKTTQQIDPDYPDGYIGTTPINYTGQLYTVPNGKNLHTTTLGSGGSDVTLINGGQTRSNFGGSILNPKETIILKAGDVISNLTGNFTLRGYLTPQIIQPVLISSFPYTVPSGKRLVLINWSCYSNGMGCSISVLINGQGPVHSYIAGVEPPLLFIDQGSNVALYLPDSGTNMLFGYLMDM